MLSAIEQFRDNIARVRSLGGLANALALMTTPLIDTSDILRAQHVLAVSALDHFVHELIRSGMLEIFDGKRRATESYSRFRISLDCVGAGLTIERVSFESEIRTQHGALTFQQPDKIADAVRLISDRKLWQGVGHRLALDPGDVKARLKLIVERRNKIAHEADLDPTYPKTRWPISAIDVEKTVTFLVEVVEATHAEVA